MANLTVLRACLKRLILHYFLTHIVFGRQMESHNVTKTTIHKNEPFFFNFAIVNYDLFVICTENLARLRRAALEIWRGEKVGVFTPPLPLASRGLKTDSCRSHSFPE